MSRFILSIVIVVLVSILPAHAQDDGESTPDAPDLESAISTQFSASRLNPLVGEPIELTLVVETPPGATIVDWPQFPEDWPPFMVRDVSDRYDVLGADDRGYYTQTLTVILWEPGEHETPETFIGYTLAGSDEIFRVPVRAVTFDVPSTIPDDATAPRPLKPQIGFFYVPLWAAMLILVLIGLAVGVGCWWIQRWLEQRALAAAESTIQTPAQIALLKMAALRGQDITVEAVYAGITESLRGFLQAVFGLNAPDMTTAEVVEALSSHDQFDNTQIHELRTLFEQADLVKFANAQPDERAASQALKIAHRWIKRTEQSVGSGDETEA